MTRMTSPYDPGSRELCYQQPDGTFDDADAHAAILDNPEAERTILAATRARLIALGEDPDLIARLYPDP